MCFMYIIKRNLVAKHGHDLSFLSIAYYIYVFGQCLVGFGCIAIVRPFEITEIIWRSDTEL